MAYQQSDVLLLADEFWFTLDRHALNFQIGSNDLPNCTRSILGRNVATNKSTARSDNRCWDASNDWTPAARWIVVCGKQAIRETINTYLFGYNCDEVSKYLMYWDMNNLYAFAMRRHLPCKHLRWDNHWQISLRLLETADVSVKGYTVEVDFEFPNHLHDTLKEFPPAPESLTPNMEWLSNFQNKIGDTSRRRINTDKYNGTDKLVPHLQKHDTYVIHYCTLKYLHKLRVIRTKLHRVISFRQGNWLQPYLEFYNDKRKAAHTCFWNRTFASYWATQCSARLWRMSRTEWNCS